MIGRLNIKIEKIFTNYNPANHCLDEQGRENPELLAKLTDFKDDITELFKFSHGNELYLLYPVLLDLLDNKIARLLKQCNTERSYNRDVKIGSKTKSISPLIRPNYTYGFLDNIEYILNSVEESIERMFEYFVIKNKNIDYAPIHNVLIGNPQKTRFKSIGEGYIKNEIDYIKKRYEIVSTCLQEALNENVVTHTCECDIIFTPKDVDTFPCYIPKTINYIVECLSFMVINIFNIRDKPNATYSKVRKRISVIKGDINTLRKSLQ